MLLPGPTGERNSYTVLTREDHPVSRDVRKRLARATRTSAGTRRPRCVAAQRTRAGDARAVTASRERCNPSDRRLERRAESEFDAVVHHGSPEERIDIARKIAARDGPIVSIHGFAPGEPPFAIERLLVERVVSVNTAAAGGNASLMTVG